MTPADIRNLADRLQYYPADGRHVMRACADVVEAVQGQVEWAALAQALAKLEAIKP